MPSASNGSGASPGDAGPADPGAVGLAHHRLHRGDQAARGALPGRRAVRARWSGRPAAGWPPRRAGASQRSLPVRPEVVGRARRRRLSRRRAGPTRRPLRAGRAPARRRRLAWRHGADRTGAGPEVGGLPRGRPARARGGMGAVYRVRDADGACRRAEAVAPAPGRGAGPGAAGAGGRGTCSKVRHPAVARVLDAELDSAEPFVVTELVDGPTSRRTSPTAGRWRGRAGRPRRAAARRARRRARGRGAAPRPHARATS